MRPTDTRDINGLATPIGVQTPRRFTACAATASTFASNPAETLIEIPAKFEFLADEAIE